MFLCEAKKKCLAANTCFLFNTDCPKDFIEKLVAGPKLKVNVEKEGDGWNWAVTVGEMTVKMLLKVGEAHAVGAHSPTYKARTLLIN